MMTGLSSPANGGTARHSPSGKTISTTSAVAFSVSSQRSDNWICIHAAPCCHSAAVRGWALRLSQRTLPSPSCHQRLRVSAGIRRRRWISAAVKALNGGLHGRGGGRNGFAQGSVEAAQSAIEAFFKEV